MSYTLLSARRRMFLVPATAGVLFSFTLAAAAQAIPRITAPASASSMVTLKGNTLPVATAVNDHGRVADNTPTGRVLMLLKHSAEQQANLDKLVTAQQSAGSTSYHHWLTTAEYAKQFGVADADVQSVTSYLAAQGFNVAKVYPNKMAIEFSGTAGQLRSAFKTEIHQYSMDGQRFSANDRDPQIPAALSAVVHGFASLNNYQPRGAAPVPVRMVAGTRHTGAHPLYTDGVNGAYNLSPGDIAAIYDIPAAYAGNGVTIGVANTSNVNLTYVLDYQKTFGLPNRFPTVIVDGDDPGESSFSINGVEQLELLSAVAPNATLNYYTSASTDASTGINFAILRAVDDAQIQVLLMDQENCEANLGTTGTAFANAVAQQAAAEGITVIAAAGNGGSASCDSSSGYGSAGFVAQATKGLSVNGYASTPYVTAVGATDFYYGTGKSFADAAGYWNQNNGNSSYTSALGYIPEQPWNIGYDGAGTNLFGAAPVVAATGGGPSTVGDSNGDTTAGQPYPAPSWQIPVLTGSLATAGARVIPDVSIFGGNGLNGSTYILCAQADECVNGAPGSLVYEAAGGTNVSSATFAGIAALVVQAHGMQGNLNPTLYSLFEGANRAAIFHAAAAGTNTVVCAAGSPNCGSNGVLVTSGGAVAYTATGGYNAAVGLGSVDVKNLIADWATPFVQSTATTFTLTKPGTSTPVSTFVHGTQVQANIAVTSSAGTPSGDVAVLTNTPLSNNVSPAGYTLSNGAVTDTSILSRLAGGKYSVQARYAGAGVFAPSFSTPFTVNISPETSNIKLGQMSFTSGSTVTFGTSISIDLVVESATDPNSIGQPTGAVTVLDNSNQLTIVPIDGTGVATFKAQLGTGSHSLTFSYPGDPSYQSSANTTGVAITVAAQPTSTALATSSTDDPKTGFVQLVAIVSAGANGTTGVPPAGTVVFQTVGTTTTTLGTVTLVPGLDNNAKLAGIANFQLPGQKLSAARSGVQAVFTPAAGSGYSASSSAVITFNFNSTGGTAATTTAVTTADGAASYFNYAGSVSLNASVTSQSGTGATPAGEVTFYTNGALLGTATLSGGAGTLTIAQNPDTGLLPAPFTLGKDIITAQYSGDKNYATSTRALTISILAENSLPDFSLLSNVTYGTLSSGSTSTAFTLQLASINNFAGLAQPIGFQALVPAGIACTFDNKTEKFVTTSIYLTNTVTCGPASGYTVAGLSPAPLHSFWLGGGAALACVLLLGIPARRKGWQSVLGLFGLAMLSLGVMTGMSACSGSTQHFSPVGESQADARLLAARSNASQTLAPGTYQVLINAKANFGVQTQANTTSVQDHTIPIQIVVQ